MRELRGQYVYFSSRDESLKVNQTDEYALKILSETSPLIKRIRLLSLIPLLLYYSSFLASKASHHEARL